MKTYRIRNLILPFLLAVGFGLGSTLRGQNAPAPAATEPPAATVTIAKEEPPKVVATEAKPEIPAAAVSAVPAVPAVSAPTATKVETAEVDDDDKETSEEKSAVAPEQTAGPEASPSSESKTKQGKVNQHGLHWKGKRHSENERVSFLNNSTLAAGEYADVVVSILGSSTSEGEVRDAVVSVLGSSTSSGKVGDAVVSVFGNTRVTGGSVGSAAVAVLGSIYVNGKVKGEVVAVLGDVELGPDAEVSGEVVCIGGKLKRDPKAIVKGNVQNIALGGHACNFDWLHAWFEKCLFYARPLAFDARLMWAWSIAFGFLGFYALIALLAPQGVNKCVQTLEEKPGFSLLASVLAMLLTPVAFLLLVLTMFIAIGFILIPLFSLGLFIAALFGKVVILAWLGRRITKLFGDGPLAQPVFGVLIGGVMVLGLYTVPVLGFILYKLIGLLGLGVVLYTLISSMKSKRPAGPAPMTPVNTAAVPPLAGENISAGVAPAAAVVAGLPPVISAATLPRAGFWLRFAASLIDLILVGFVFSMMRKILFGVGDVYPLWLTIYAVVMWATKGTTIGGIICGLKVVRLDDRPLDWSIAIVRALSAFLSLVFAGLGFIWVAFDDDKQSWHDKIAGTTIVVVPKGTPLL